MWRRGADALGSQAIGSLAAALSVIERADVVFPAVHGPSGEDGTLAALCASRTSRWSARAARRSARHGQVGDQARGGGRRIHTAPGRLAAAENAEIADIEFETDVVVKPASAGSSFGVALARDTSSYATCCVVRRDSTPGS